MDINDNPLVYNISLGLALSAPPYPTCRKDLRQSARPHPRPPGCCFDQLQSLSWRGCVHVLVCVRVALPPTVREDNPLEMSAAVLGFVYPAPGSVLGPSLVKRESEPRLRFPTRLGLVRSIPNLEACGLGTSIVSNNSSKNVLGCKRAFCGPGEDTSSSFLVFPSRMTQLCH